MGEHGRVAVKFAHQASEVQATLATLRFVGSLAVIFIIFMSCRLRILGNAKHLGFWET